MISNYTHNPFIVPNDYFNHLESKIFKRLERTDSKTLVDGFSIPIDYFNELEIKILERVEKNNEVDSNSLDKINAKSVFNVPSNYFENLETQINLRVSLESISESDLEVILCKEAPNLFSTNRDLPFSVPSGYFRNEFVKQVYKEPKTKIVVLSTTVIAIAAVIVLAIIVFLPDLTTRSSRNELVEHITSSKVIVERNSFKNETDVDMEKIQVRTDKSFDSLVADVGRQEAIEYLIENDFEVHDLEL